LDFIHDGGHIVGAAQAVGVLEKIRRQPGVPGFRPARVQPVETAEDQLERRFDRQTAGLQVQHPVADIRILAGPDPGQLHRI
jgi:hypothetical protein